ncbi:hypothetical protein [Hyalangium sp.]|uniref:hypothetical protein n=1 Tax=Hyalangium sp. TaxID=2028555 RepID=UPI002D74923B|nr:hypothetical protein [Hyalangium sp.]HYH96664.1 hypothetical protein [Hyalangium sp.]
MGATGAELEPSDARHRGRAERGDDCCRPGARHRAELELSDARTTGAELELSDACATGTELELSSVRAPPGRAGAVHRARHRAELELSDARAPPGPSWSCPTCAHHRAELELSTARAPRGRAGRGDGGCRPGARPPGPS